MGTRLQATFSLISLMLFYIGTSTSLSASNNDTTTSVQRGNRWIPWSIHDESISPFAPWYHSADTTFVMQTLSNAKMVDGVISFADSCFLANGTLSYKWIAGFNYVDLLGQEIIGDKASLQVYDANYFYSLPQPQQAPVLNQQFEIKESNICNAGWLALDDVYYLYCVTMETHGNCADIAVFSFDADSKLRIVAEATLWATYVWEIDNIKGLGPAFIYFRCWSLGPDQSEGVVEINPFTLDEGFNTYYNINLGDLLTEEEIAKLGSLDDYERIISYALTIRDDWRQFLIAGHDNRTGYGTNANGSTYPIRFSGAPMWQEHDIQ